MNDNDFNGLDNNISCGVIAIFLLFAIISFIIYNLIF